VHAVFSVHVRIYIWYTRHFSVHVFHSFKYRIICSLLCDCLFPPLFSSFSFWCMQIVYTTVCTTSPWNFTKRWHTGTCCPDIRHFTKYTSGIYCILWKFQHITGMLISLYFITVLLYPDVYPFYCIYSLYTVYTLCWHSHIGFTYTKRIHLVYLWYTSLHKKVNSVYNMYTSGFIFLGCVYDHRTFMLFQT